MSELTQLDKVLRKQVLQDVSLERDRQNNKWGRQRNDWGTWLGILGEEFGEVCQAINASLLPIQTKETDASDLYMELTHLAAVAVAMAEQIIEEKNIDWVESS